MGLLLEESSQVGMFNNCLHTATTPYNKPGKKCKERSFAPQYQYVQDHATLNNNSRPSHCETD